MINVKFSDIEFLNEWGGDVWKKHSKEWTLKDSMDFLYRFENDLIAGDWYDMLLQFEKEEFQEYYFDGKLFEIDENGQDIGYIESGWYHELNEDGDVIDEYKIV
jgi:hypothetical protein